MSRQDDLVANNENIDLPDNNLQDITPERARSAHTALFRAVNLLDNYQGEWASEAAAIAGIPSPVVGMFISVAGIYRPWDGVSAWTNTGITLDRAALMYYEYHNSAKGFSSFPLRGVQSSNFTAVANNIYPIEDGVQVTLPAGLAGDVITLIYSEDSGNDIVPDGSETINGVNATLGVSGSIGNVVQIHCAVDGVWLLGTGGGTAGVIASGIVQAGGDVNVAKGVSLDPSDDADVVEGRQAFASRSTTTGHTGRNFRYITLYHPDEKLLVFQADDMKIYLFYFVGPTLTRVDLGTWNDGALSGNQDQTFAATITDDGTKVAVAYIRTDTTEKVYLRVGPFVSGTNTLTLGSEVEVGDTADTGDTELRAVGLDVFPSTDYALCVFPSKNVGNDHFMNAFAFDMGTGAKGTTLSTLTDNSIQEARAAQAASLTDTLSVGYQQVFQGTNLHHYLLYSRSGNSLTLLDTEASNANVQFSTDYADIAPFGTDKVVVTGFYGFSEDGYNYQVLSIIGGVSLSLGPLSTLYAADGSNGPDTRITKKFGNRASTEGSLILLDNASAPTPFVAKVELQGGTTLVPTVLIPLQDPNQDINTSGNTTAEISENLFVSVWDDGGATSYYNSLTLDDITQFVGVAIETKTGDEEVQYLLKGNLETSGLTPGSYYSLSFDGSIIEGINENPLGVATSATNLLVDFSLFSSNTQEQLDALSASIAAAETDIDALQAAVALLSPPGGSDRDIQFNNAGAFEGDPDLRFDATKVLQNAGKDLVPGVKWNAVTTPSQDFTCITYGDGYFYMGNTDDSNSIWRSHDGVTWEQLTVPSPGRDFRGICYGAGKLIAVASDGTASQQIIVSEDRGETWTEVEAPAAQSWQSITYGNGRFVAISSSGSQRVMYSDDGYNWIGVFSLTTNSWQAVTYGNGLFVAVAVDGTDRIMTSPDGINWTDRTAPENLLWYDVVFGNGLFVAVGGNGTDHVMTSPDGINWVSRAHAGTSWYSCVAYGGGMFVALRNAQGAAGERAMSSPDGINWSVRTSVSDQQFLSVAYGNGRFVGCGQNGTGDHVVWSGALDETDKHADPDKRDIIARDIKASGNSQISGIVNQVGRYWDGDDIVTITQSAQAVAYGNGLFVACMADDANMWTSVDGKEWDSTNAVEANVWVDICYGKGRFVAVSIGGTNRVSVSFDGANWYPVAAAAANAWRSICYGNGLFVAVADTGTGDRVMTSTDGFTWVTQTNPTDNDYQAITFGNGLFVAVADTGTGDRVMTSPDGINWTDRTSAADNNWMGVTFGNGLFVAVANTGTGDQVMTSPDGITWASRVELDSGTWVDVIYANGVFVAVRNSGDQVFMVSHDGITWEGTTYDHTGVTSVFTGLAYGDGLLVAVNSFGTYRTLTSGRRNNDLPLGLGVLANYFRTLPQTITSGALLTIAHKMNHQPLRYDLFLECTTAEANWAIGDLVPVGLNNSDSTTDRVNSVYADATNIYFRFTDATGAFVVGNKTTGALTVITNGNWNLVIVAYA